MRKRTAKRERQRAKMRRQKGGDRRRPIPQVVREWCGVAEQVFGKEDDGSEFMRTSYPGEFAPKEAVSDGDS